MRIFHTADVHLGAVPDAGYPWARKNEAALKETFVRLIERVRAEKPELLLISGDLFHRPPSVNDLQFVDSLFASVPDTEVVLCAGNHDYIGPDARQKSFSFSPNVTGLWAAELESVSFQKPDVRVYGLSYHGFEAERDLYEGAHPAGDETFHILMLHGGDAKHSPVKREKLAAMGFDYIALGHIHKPCYLIENRAAFSGALTPIDRNDTGEHGYLEVTLAAGREPQLQFVPFAPFAYRSLMIQTKASDTVLTVEEKIRAGLAAENPADSFRIVLEGEFKGAQLLDVSRLWNAGHVLEILDQTAEEPDYAALCRKHPGTLLEAYIRSLSGRTDEVGRIALREGTKAILEQMKSFGRASFEEE